MSRERPKQQVRAKDVLPGRVHKGGTENSAEGAVRHRAVSGVPGGCHGGAEASPREAAPSYGCGSKGETEGPGGGTPRAGAQLAGGRTRSRGPAALLSEQGCQPAPNGVSCGAGWVTPVPPELEMLPRGLAVAWVTGQDHSGRRGARTREAHRKAGGKPGRAGLPPPVAVALLRPVGGAQQSPRVDLPGPGPDPRGPDPRGPDPHGLQPHGA